MLQKTVKLEILEDNLWDGIAVLGNCFLIDVNENTNLNTSTVCISFLCSFAVALLKYVNGTGIVALIYIFDLQCRNSCRITDGETSFFSSYEVA